ncbi:uncharacterized protein TEOVI_000678400 [Trypanosoma equiperdum]|uniref:Uncharacterized protein n=2 Tax=Trypanozoon TaxID=39700 RepID=Q583N2_TRYB2|nr:hypothetical protein, conserved [Trypanosoma brucei brucei TREU927]AAX81005.1 hypothetical protein, conserved [Trypanosoma brucei]AAZ11864.1 hypothetical protein, conserved [Trypanosoma brucei brucei TREU927]SCU67663.1 hypothetical protein, conserved [Trypanosoma equiperdum]
MQPRKTVKKVDVEPSPEEDAELLPHLKVSAKWSERAANNGKSLSQVQFLLGALGKQLEDCNKELASVYANADLLSSLRITEYRQRNTPGGLLTPTRKARTKRNASTRPVARQQLDENSTEALIAAMDEKKRARVTAALIAFFKRDMQEQNSPAYQNASTPVPQGANHSSTRTSQTLGRIPSANSHTMLCESNKGNQPSCSNGNELPTLLSETQQQQLRRHRDIPPELWDEMAKLRLRRLSLEEKIGSLLSNINAQTERFGLLMEVQGVNSYSTESVNRAIEMIRQKRA